MKMKKKNVAVIIEGNSILIFWNDSKRNPTTIHTVTASQYTVYTRAKTYNNILYRIHECTNIICI